MIKMKKTLFALMTLSFCSFNLSAIASDVSDIAEFNEKYTQYAASCPELKASVESVREFQHYYTDAVNANGELNCEVQRLIC